MKDPYRWLEDADSEETKKFVEAQNALSKPYIDQCQYKDQIYKRYKQLYEYPRYGCPFKKGNNYFMFINSGLQNQSVLYIMRNSLDAPQEVLLDPNELSPDGTVSLSVNTSKFSHDGKWYAYGISKSGSDWVQVKIKNVETGQDLPDELNKLKFTCLAWTLDNKGFFYSYYPQHLAADEGKSDGTETTKLINQKLFYHRLNTPQSEDVCVYDRNDEPHYRFNPFVTNDGRYVHVFTNKTCEYNLWHFCQLDDPLNPQITGYLPFEPIVTEFNADYDYVANDGPVHYFHTNRNASNYRLVSVNLSDTLCRFEENWKDIIKEDPKDVLQFVAPVRRNLIACGYISDVISKLEIRKLSDGTLVKKVPLPVGSISDLKCERDHEELFYVFTSFLTPGTIYRLKLTQDLNQEPTIFKESKPKGFEPSNFVIKQVFITSKDGTKVPIFIVHKKVW